jgi:hypothetical protein
MHHLDMSFIFVKIQNMDLDEFKEDTILESWAESNIQSQLSLYTIEKSPSSSKNGRFLII